MPGIISAVTSLITHLGYPGMCVWMLLESACIPVPGKAMTSFAGLPVAMRHSFILRALALTGTDGYLTGTVVAYWLRTGEGRGFFGKCGKYMTIIQSDPDIADNWFATHGDATVCFAGFHPVARTRVSLPADRSRRP